MLKASGLVVSGLFLLVAGLSADFVGRPSPSAAETAAPNGAAEQTADAFRKREADQKRRLSLADFRKMPPEVAFLLNDQDGDGSVSESELTTRTGRPAAEVKRDFLLFDRDADGLLNQSEFATLPSVVPFLERGRLPDPFLKLVDRYVVLLDKHWDDWDADATGELSPNEFNQGLIDTLQLPITMLASPDANNDGVVTHEEARGAIELLLGVRASDGQLPARGVVNLALPEGGARPAAGLVGGIQILRPARRPLGDQPLRLPGGAVINLIYFRQLDLNHSSGLDLAEFQKIRLPAAEIPPLFARCDEDADGQISITEWRLAFPHGAADPVADFRYLDVNLDGSVDRDELLKWSSSWKEKVVGHVFPGFDFDGDGKLSLAEFRFSPLANPLVNWYQNIRDNDGKLTFEEFAVTSEPFDLLRWHYFERFDLNSDGVLDRQEFYFQLRTPRAFYTLNADGTGWSKLFELEGYSNCGSPMVSPDGKTLAFDAWNAAPQGQTKPETIFAVDIDGTHSRAICQGQMPSWSPDGKFFACSRREGGSGIAIMTAAGQENRRIGDGWAAQWSPDGKKIAYYEGNRLMVYNIETNVSHDLLGAANPYRQVYWNMCWSPDSKRICFRASKPDGASELAIVDARGAEHGLKVRFNERAFSSKFAWHPRDSRLVFAMSCPERRLVQLYELDPNTDAPPVLTPGQDSETPNYDPCWTPDGKRLIIVTGGY